MFKKGESGNPGGRRKGSSIKDRIQAVYEGIGGIEAMTAWAKENQTEFYKLYGRLIPTDINFEGDAAFVEAVSGLSAFMAKATGQGEAEHHEGMGQGGPVFSSEIPPTAH